MTKNILSYAEAVELNGDLLFYDHNLSENVGFSCLYCDKITHRIEPRDQYVFICENCGWWQMISGAGGFGINPCIIHRARLKKYPIKSLDVPLIELRQYLRNHPNDVAFTNPTAFERLLCECLRDKYEHCEVIHVGGTADRGIDIILIRSGEGPRLVQVKRRRDLLSAEGVKVVRELNGVLFRDNVAKGMVITTAAKFTKAAVNEKAIGTPTGEAYDMQLLAYNDVVDLFDVKPRNPHEPWLRFM